MIAPTPRRRRLAGACRAGAWLVGLATAACTQTLDFSQECATDRACDSLGPGLACRAGRCVPGADGPDEGIVRDATVEPRDAGPPGIEGLLAEGCTVVGPPDAEEAPQRHLLFAALVPPRPAEADAARAAIALAVRELNDAGGLGGRQFAFLVCTEPTDPTTLVERARRMAEAATLPALVGASTAEGTARIYADAMQPLGLVLVRPGGPEPSRAAVGDTGLLWHLVEGGPASARAAAALAEHQGGRTVIVHRDAPAEAALAEAIEAAVCPGGCRVPFAPFTVLDEVAQAVADAAPDLTLTIAQPEDFPSLYAALADRAVTATVAVEGPTRAEALADFLVLDADGETGLPPWRWAARVALLCESGTLNAAGEGPVHADWAARFDAAWPGLTRWPSTARYADAVFLLAYAYAAAGGEASGERLAAGFARLQAGPLVAIGGADWTRGLELLEGGIDLEGASSGLKFDLESGIARSGVDLSWYDGLPAVVRAGRVVDEAGVFMAPAPRPRCGEE